MLGGIEASGNVAGAGIALDLAGIDLDAQVLVANVTANSNGTQGVALDLFSLNEDSIAALIDVEASYNGQQGVQFVGESTDDDVIALMAGVETAHNGREGIHATLTAGEYAALAMTGVESTYNGTNGATVVMNAGDDADFFAGTNAAPDLDTLYDFFDDLGPLSNRVPFGPVRFDYNGGDGLNVDLTSTARGNATALFAGGTASSNTGNGIMMAGDAYASTGQVDLIANDVVALGNGGGVDVDQFARLRQAGGSCTLIFSGVADTVNQHSTFDP